MSLADWTGVFPAAVTPFTAEDKLDELSVARLLGYFDAAGCKGVVLAGTNGEGPSLAAVEKRDLLRTANLARGRLLLVLGIATPSLSEAVWLCEQAGKNGGDAVLLMPPGYFRTVSDTGIESWFVEVMDRSSVPVIIYNYPKMTGITLTFDLVSRLAQHPRMMGVKDSSGELANLAGYRSALGSDKALFLGDETILMEALSNGWTGTISGAANVLPTWISRVVRLWHEGKLDESAEAYQVVAPLIGAVRKAPQPASNKAVLAALDVIASSKPRLPLEEVAATDLLAALKERLGVTAERLGLDRRSG
ncbi:MAG: dihydrodipicolinate synthase family protein [Armatimonadetes bacterium]|nr:dihydrodipicolinate synthase family protein [Armatimonadota bacterium]